MPRKTIHMAEAVVETVDELAGEGESFSAAACRLIEAGARVERGRRRPEFIGAAEDGSSDLGRRAEEYLADPVTAR